MSIVEIKYFKKRVNITIWEQGMTSPNNELNGSADAPPNFPAPWDGLWGAGCHAFCGKCGNDARAKIAPAGGAGKFI